ncbi:unnamed protein product [Trichobilharzia regenti]|nr:unnamed protein product [Trichobilharzia regenti]
MCEEESPVLSDLFAQIGLSVHQFQGHYKQPAYTSPTSDKNCSKQSVIDNTTPHSSTLSKIAIIPHERAQRLGILRSVKLHEACFEFLSSSSTEDVKKWSHLYKQAYPKSLFSIILDLMNWIVLMYYHELEFPCDVITNLLNLAGNSCENLIENLIVYGDRETTQLGTKFLFSLLK